MDIMTLLSPPSPLQQHLLSYFRDTYSYIAGSGLRLPGDTHSTSDLTLTLTWRDSAGQPTSVIYSLQGIYKSPDVRVHRVP
ncbi:hypothetical protein Hamer_G006353 [Homarus americanus]|uniref:Uncharacterized protein n=1 Tax=Homarus americanus TaxID=6706 RepID=A0A8J5JQG6_HOMAM|nr:hypothetical protein Hamer_G006353 [Homarus americanus]